MNTKNSSHDDISYRLLDELDKESFISQRALADRLGIALGLVNAYIKRLYKKGHIKIRKFPRNRIKYIITPQGFAEKSRLTYKYMQFSIKYFKEIRQKIEVAYAQMIGAGVNKILLWGDGELAELCYISTRGFPIEIVGVVGEKRVDKGFFDCHVYTPHDVDSISFDAIFVSTVEEKAMLLLSEFNIDPEKIYYLEKYPNGGARNHGHAKT